MLGGAGDWPDSDAGPVNGANGRKYLRTGAPDALSSDLAQVVAAGATAPAPNRYSLQYAPAMAAPGGWTITIRDTQGKGEPCSIGGGAHPPLPEQPC